MVARADRWAVQGLALGRRRPWPPAGGQLHLSGQLDDPNEDGWTPADKPHSGSALRPPMRAKIGLARLAGGAHLIISWIVISSCGSCARTLLVGSICLLTCRLEDVEAVIRLWSALCC